MRHIRQFDKDVIKKAKTLIMIVPYSIYNEEVISLIKTLSNQTPDDVKPFVDFMIESDIYNIYICILNIDDVRYKVDITDKRPVMRRDLNLLLNTIFNNLVNVYIRYYNSPSIAGRYFANPKGISKVVLNYTMFGKQTRNLIKLDMRKDNPLFNDELKAIIGNKMSDVVCAVLTNRDIMNDTEFNDNPLTENPFDKALWDVMTYGFVPDSNNATIMV